MNRPTFFNPSPAPCPLCKAKAPFLKFQNRLAIHRCDECKGLEFGIMTPPKDRGSVHVTSRRA